MNSFVDLWGWFHKCQADAHRDDNPAAVRMTSLFSEIWDSFDRDPNHALACCNEAIAIAKQLHVPCMALFYGYWRCEAYLFFLGQIETGLKESIRLALEAQKPEYEHCPIRARVYRVLVNAYVFSDSYGYASEIETMLDYLEQEVPLDKDTWLLLTKERSSLAADREDFEKAYELAEIYRARSEDENFRLMDAYMTLCSLCYKLKRFELIKDFAISGEACARSENRPRSLSTLLGWKAYGLYMAGEKTAARRAAAEAVRVGTSLGSFPLYQGPLCLYHEAQGEFEKSVELRKQQLDMELKTKSMDGEAILRLELCNLYAKMNLPIADELAAARKATVKLRRPDKILRKLDQLERGESID